MIDLTTRLQIPDAAVGLVICMYTSIEQNNPDLSVFHKYKLATLPINLPSFSDAQIKEMISTIIDQLADNFRTADLDICLFGGDIEAGPALAAIHSPNVKAVTLRGRYTRPDTEPALISHAPILLVASGRNKERAQTYQEILKKMDVESRLHIIPRASTAFTEPGVMEESAQLAALWFLEKTE